jgi:multidrug efflux system membrane fusion protein
VSVIPRVGVAAIGVVGCYLVWHTISSRPAVSPPARPLIPVEDGRSQLTDVPVFVSGIGYVQAFNLVGVKSRVDGQITQVFFKEGQDVQEGDPLFQIDPRPFQAALDQAVGTKEKDEAQLKGAQLDLERFAKLVVPGYQTRQSFENQQASVAQLQATVKADAARIAAAQLNLDYALIRSPIAGRTGQRMVDVGNMVSGPQATNLVTITQLKPTFVSFTVPQDGLDEIRQNQAKHPLEVVALAADDEIELAKGTLTLIDNQVDAVTGTIHLKARFENADERLWPGEFVNARLILSVRKDAVTVPAQTVMQTATGSYVYVIKPDNSVERREVEVAMRQQGLVVITKGLAADEHVVVDGQYRLANGAKVKSATQNAASMAP